MSPSSWAQFLFTVPAEVDSLHIAKHETYMFNRIYRLWARSAECDESNFILVNWIATTTTTTTVSAMQVTCTHSMECFFSFFLLLMIFIFVIEINKNVNAFYVNWVPATRSSACSWNTEYKNRKIVSNKTVALVVSRITKPNNVKKTYSDRVSRAIKLCLRRIMLPNSIQTPYKWFLKVSVLFHFHFNNNNNIRS